MIKEVIATDEFECLSCGEPMDGVAEDYTVRDRINKEPCEICYKTMRFERFTKDGVGMVAISES